MKEEAAKLEEDAEFSEFSQEEDYRRRLRQEAEARAGDQVSVTLSGELDGGRNPGLLYRRKIEGEQIL